MGWGGLVWTEEKDRERETEKGRDGERLQFSLLFRLGVTVAAELCCVVPRQAGLRGRYGHAKRMPAATPGPLELPV